MRPTKNPAVVGGELAGVSAELGTGEVLGRIQSATLNCAGEYISRYRAPVVQLGSLLPRRDGEADKLAYETIGRRRKTPSTRHFWTRLYPAAALNTGAMFIPPCV